MTTNNKKAQFLDKTLKLVYEKGFMATSMRDIAKHSNFEVSNVYNYIDSKEELLAGVLFQIFEEFNGYMTDVLSSSYPPKDKLKFLISKHIRFTFEKPYQVALFVYDWRNLKEPNLREFKELRKTYLLNFGSIIADGIKAGEFRNVDVQMATFLVFSSLRWLFNIIIHDDREHNPIEMEKQITDYIFGVSDSE